MRYAVVLLMLTVAAPGWALSGAKVDVDQPDLKQKADEVVEVNLEGKSLEQGSRLLAIRHGVSAPVKSLLGKLKGIYRRTYRFATGGGYEDADVASIHLRMTGEGWAPVIDVKDNNKRETVTVYSYTEGENVSGVTVVSSDPSEVTVVNIVGDDVDLQALIEASESFGAPIMQLGSTELEKLKVKLPAETPAKTQK